MQNVHDNENRDIDMNASTIAPRTIVPPKKYHSEELSPGVVLERFYPGGKDGPNGEVLGDIPGGQTWADYVLVGGQDDPFQAMVPDIRMPPNQYWPPHWHDTWTVVLPLEGGCIIGDWYMRPGDIFIAEPGVEYGPLLIGPYGCRLLEIFAKGHLAPGGYSPEFRDHPTLRGSNQNFAERSPLNRHNDGHQMLPLDGVEIAGLQKSRLQPGKSWSLGQEDDPQRGLMSDTLLAPEKTLPAHRHEDWHFMLVLEGTATLAGRRIEKDCYLLIHPNAVVGSIQAGPEGVRLLELSRTAQGALRRPV